jgi:uncharacterized protein Veg
MIIDVGKIEELTQACTANVENVLEFTVTAGRCVTQNANIYSDTIGPVQSRKPSIFIIHV